MAFTQSPARSISVSAEMRWTQEASGQIDISRSIADAFADAGTTRTGLCSSYTGQGLASDWPQSGEEIGGGWRVASSRLDRVDGTRFRSEGKVANVTEEGSAIYFPLWSFQPRMVVAFEAERDRTETLAFTVGAGVQPLVIEDTEDDTIRLSFRSAAAGETIDGVRPVGDLTRRSYLQTARGEQSIQNLILRARALLLAEARAVDVFADIPFAQAVGLSCRHSATLADARLPGGTATGKIVRYSFGLSGESGELYGTVNIACTIGDGGTLSTTAPGDRYVGSGYVSDGWQAFTSGDLTLGPGDVAYTYAATAIQDDDIDFAQFGREQAVIDCTVTNGQTAQEAVLNAAHLDPSEAMAALNEAATEVQLQMRQVDGLTFQTDYALTVSDLVVPKTIDLEAA